MLMLQILKMMNKIMMVKKMKPSSTTILTRYLSTVQDPLLQQLSTILDNLLYEYEDDLENIEQIINKQILLSGRYVLSPLSVI